MKKLLIALAVGMICVADANWISQTDTRVETVFYQGLMASQTQAAKYVDASGFMTTTGDWALCPKYASSVIQHIFIGTEIDEIKLVSADAHASYASYVYPISYVYSLLKYLELDRYGIQVRREGSQERTVFEHRVRPSKLSFGQEVAIKNHHEKYTLCMQQHPDCHVILFGVSQGATTTFNALARHQYDVRMAILEAPFDSVDHLISCMPFIKRHAMQQAIKWLPSYSAQGVQAVKQAHLIPQDIPILFITSIADTVVPAECTINLASKLAKSGHKNVYMLKLHTSAHARYTMDDASDTCVYQGFVHAAYKKYGLPYIPEYANRIADLDEYRLTA
jgi:hypothetical protein